MNINQVWPEWNEDCVLGEGSFGKVYRAKRIEYGRTFYSAIKVLTVPKSQQEIKFARSQGMNDTEIYNYFQGLVDNLLNEITLMDNLKGAQNIVGIEDYKIIERQGEIGWDIFIRMELLTPFDSFVSNPEFSQKDVIRLGVDICTALEVCERNYIVHRDIKPDNIFISRFGEYKLGDFGIARKLEATQANLSRKGTLNYMAPEVYKSEEYGSNVDIYSLGLVLYTLLNNNRIAFLPPYPQPITYKDNEEALSRRLSGEPLLLPCNAGASLGAVIAKACAYRSQDRYQSATEFKNALINEWNVLVQSGDNAGIHSDAMRFGSNMSEQLQNTTNGMTANGQLVVEEYSQGTTVMNESYSQEDVNYDVSLTSGVISTAKSSKVCRFLAYPLALAVCVLAIVTLTVHSEPMLGCILLSIGLIILLTDHNKRAIGISTLALSSAYIDVGIFEFISAMQESDNQLLVYATISLIAGLLILFGGIVIVSQKEVRFGGTLCMGAIVLETLYYIYQFINSDLSIEGWNIFFGIAMVTVVIWSYGYNSDEEVKGIKKILQSVTLVLASAIALYAMYYTITSVGMNF